MTTGNKHNTSLDSSPMSHILLSKIPTNVLEAELSKRHDRDWCSKCFAHRTLHAHKAGNTMGSHMHEAPAISIIICEGCDKECVDCTCQPTHA